MYALNQPVIDNLGLSLYESGLWSMGDRLADIPKHDPTGTLSDFVAGCWHIIEPGRPYIHGWHIDAISEHLTAATEGEIDNLIINMPPRHMKSTLICVAWFCWVWTFKPESRWVFSSYADNLSTRDSLKCRRILQSAWYQANWGSVFFLTGDQNQKTRFENNLAGYRIATSVGGGGTGEGGEFIVTDDPLKAKDAFTGSKRLEEVNDWWDHTMSTRGNDNRTVRVVVAQRLHENDLPGHLIDEMLFNEGTRYEVLCLPARHEPNRSILTTGWVDPRSEPGELLWPERFTEEKVTQLERELGEAAPGQLQQRPTSGEGGTFLKSWWGISHPGNPDVLPINRYLLGGEAPVGRWMFYDTALKDKDRNDYSALSIFELMPDYRIRLRYQWQKRIISAKLPDLIEEQAAEWNTDGLLQGVVIEDKASGITAIQTLEMSAESKIANKIQAFQSSQSKEYRANLASIWCGRSCVLIPYPGIENADWFTTFFDYDKGQLFTFPLGTFDDLVDTFSMGVIFLEHYLAAGWRARLEGGIQ